MEGCRRRMRAARYLRRAAPSVAQPTAGLFLAHYHREIDKRKGRTGAHQARKSRCHHPSITPPPAFTLPTPLRTGRSDFKLIGQSFFIVQNSSWRHSKWSHNFRAFVPLGGYEDRQRRGDPYIHLNGYRYRALRSVKTPGTHETSYPTPHIPADAPARHCSSLPTSLPPFHRTSL